VSRLLLDTHAVLWWMAGATSLSATAEGAIADPANQILVSAASVWEIAMKCALGQLHAPDGLPDAIAEEGFDWLPVTAAHAWAVGRLPLHHRDPFDRLLIAQAKVEGVAILTADPRFGAYGVGVRW
jgi:PIN domain nuclease of toxin-antitoxin system